MEICALASGSSGNCFYVGDKNGAVLIDAGISAKQICERMNISGKSPESVRAIFITHEHSDHITGADVFARRFQIPIFITKKTAENSFVCSERILVKIIKNNQTVKIAKMKIEAFPKSHHAVDPVSYSIYGKKKVCVITDIGHGCKNVRKHISDSDFLILESNHDEKVLEKGPYPLYLKELIKSDIGHLSNRQAGLCVLEHSSKKLKNIVLAHLSNTNNNPETAFRTFTKLIQERKDISPRVGISVRERPTELFRI